MVVMDDADWRTTGQLFRNASAGRPQVILAPNIAIHTTDSMIDWILEMSSECGNGGSYFVYGRSDASALAMSLALRECAATAAVALVSPTAVVASAFDATRVQAGHIPVRAFLAAHDRNSRDLTPGATRRRRRAGPASGSSTSRSSTGTDVASPRRCSSSTTCASAQPDAWVEQLDRR
jgi:hypothetical protein